MKKKRKQRVEYTTPICLITPVQTEYYLLAGSPNARPGGDAGGDTEVRPFDPDNSGSGGVVEPDDE